MWCEGGAAVLDCGSVVLFVWCVVGFFHLSEILTCYGFEGSEFWCAFLCYVCNVIPKSHSVVVGDSEYLNLVGVRDVSVVQGDRGKMCVVMFCGIISDEGGCGLSRCYL